MKTHQVSITMLLLLIIIGVVLAALQVFKVANGTDESQYMLEACVDIQSHETLRAQEDFDRIVNTIYNHVHSYRNNSDTVLARAILKLRSLREEAEFRNTDIPYYHLIFSEVLNRLAYVELEDAIYMTEHKDTEKAHLAIVRAEHYLHDALFFSENPHIEDEKHLFESVNVLSHETPDENSIQNRLKEMKKYI